MTAIRSVCVVGAGVMGAAIAAQIANSATRVLLLDLAPVQTGAARDQRARDAVARLLKTGPAPLMSPRAASLIETGCIEDDLARAGECDWIIEAIIERADIKQDLYRRLEEHRRPGTAISSNTSTIQLAALLAGLPERIGRDFLITHFFNPPRYMRLVEIVASPQTDSELVERIADLCDRRLGKSVVRAHDTPGFIANRIGAFWLQRAVVEALAMGLTVEEADAAMGAALGFPKTGIFGLIDLIGLDLMPHINANLSAKLPETDPFRAMLHETPLLDRMIAQGLTGRKGKGGFYRINRSAGTIRESIDLFSGEYRPSQPVELPSPLSRDPKALLASEQRPGRFAWKVMSATLSYAASLVPEIADDIVAVDDAMRLGFNWKQGPFELLDRLGPAEIAARLRREGALVPALLDAACAGSFYKIEDGQLRFRATDGTWIPRVRPAGIMLLEDFKRAAPPVLHNRSAALWDLGDGVACFEIQSKMNVIDEQVLDLLGQAIARVAKEFKALVLYTDAEHFSAGVNLGLALFAVNIAAWSEIEKLIAAGQRTFKAMKYAPFPVVAAPAGLALGGGCEMLLHADAVQAHAELYTGLVECGVGLVPGWGGCGEMLERWFDPPEIAKGPMPAVTRVFEIVSAATTSKSADDAKTLRFLRDADGITMHRDRLLSDAKARALSMVAAYTPPKPPEFKLPGPSGRRAMRMAAQALHERGIATAHDLAVADGLAEILSGGEADPPDAISENAMLELERGTFLRLLRTAPTLARIEHTLATGKPLRN